jgi:hypothetical protein
MMTSQVVLTNKQPLLIHSLTYYYFFAPNGHKISFFR